MLELGLALKPLKAALNLGLYFLLLAILRTAFVQVAKAFSANFFFGFNNHFFQIDFFRRYLKSSQSGQWPTCATFWRQWSDSRRCMWHRPYSYICIGFIIWGRRRASFFTSMWMFLFGLLFVLPDCPLPATSLPISQQYVWCTRAQGLYIVLPTLTPCKRLNFSTMSLSSSPPWALTWRIETAVGWILITPTWDDLLCVDLSFHYLVHRWCYRRTWRDFVATGPARREALILQYRRDLWGFFSPQWVGVLPLSL